MSVINAEGGYLTNVIMLATKMRGDVVTLGGDLTLGKNDPTLQVLDPGGAARNVDLPAEADSTDRLFIITNRADGAENITVRNDAAGTIATLTGSATPGSSETGVFWCDGTTWYSILTSTYDEA